MVSALEWALVGFGLYWLGLLWARQRGLLPSYVGTQGPIITLHTKRFRDLLDRLAAPRRAWRAWGNLGVGVTLVVMAGTFLFLATAAASTLRNPPAPTTVNRPRNVLVIPGVNDFLPLSVAPEIVAGLLVGLVVHEGGHGLLCRVGDIDIASMGLALLAVVPIGAFVEPDEDSRRRADRGDQTRMFAAGVTNNFAVAAVAFALLFGPVAGAIAVAPGAAVGGVLPGSAAAEAGITQGDRIVAVEGRPVADNAALDEVLATIEDRTVAVTVVSPDGERHIETVERSLLVTGVTDGTPFASLYNNTIVAVDGEEVHTQGALEAALADARVVTFETADGGTVSGPAGALVWVQPDGPSAAAGLPVGEPLVIVAIDGQRVASAGALSTVMDRTSPGDVVQVAYYVDGQRRVASVTLGEHPQHAGEGFLGVSVAPGVSGVSISDFGVERYPADVYLGLLGGDGASVRDTFLERVFAALLLPVAAVTGALPYNFAGFTGGITNFYQLTGPLAGLGGSVFLLANVLFWTAWINLNLGVFNCIPAFPLDGGHLLRMATESVVARLPIRRRRAVTTAVTTAVGLTMLAALVLTLFGPQLLG
ncbi:MAG: site-2 protease family protein [Halobacteriales archaeon]